MKEQSNSDETFHLSNLPPNYIFQHEKLLEEIGPTPLLDQNKLVNKLNYLNFIDGHFFAIFQHNEQQEKLILKAYPKPCIKDELTCFLEPSYSAIPDFAKLNLQYMMVDDGLTTILAPAVKTSINNNELKITLPEKSYAVKKRKTKRYACETLLCQLMQNGFSAQGELIDFTPQAFSAKFNSADLNNSFNATNPTIITISNNGSTIFSGLCRCLRKEHDYSDGKIVFAPLNTQSPLFPKRELRNPRQRIAPSFSTNFIHPFFKKNVEKDVFDISTSGFSVIDSLEEEVFLPGMIIPDLSIVYAGIFKMDCSAQVIYRHEDQDNNTVHCGLAISDMDVHSYGYLNHLLSVYLDKYSRVSTKVDMDALWEFFFDTGFIYSEKYKHLQLYRNTFKETYRKLYEDNPDIAKHFIYEKNGKIYGHNAMIHAYNPSWMIHHLAARPMETRIPGFMLIKQTTNYINGIHHFPSSGMDYVMVYYRPENRVMDSVFGGFAKYLNNPQGSSIDLFSYIHFPKNTSNCNLPSGWIVRECTPSDFDKLNDFYNNHSNGLLLSAMDLSSSINSLKEAYTKAGFIRNCQTFCLCFKNHQVAFLIVNQSDIGLNLSDLINGVKIIIIDGEKAKWDIISCAINKMADFYQENTIPLIIYPQDYLSTQCIENYKYYQLWILRNNPYSEDFTKYLEKKFRMKYR